jgi:hypothetical protein
MQPTKANIDGVNRTPPLPLSPAVERRPETNQLPPQKVKPAKKNNENVSQVGTSTLQTGPMIVILLTLVIMIGLIALAYLAYTKTK